MHYDKPTVICPHCDHEYMARQQELAWQDHLARVEWLRRMAVHSIRNQPFF